MKERYEMCGLSGWFAKEGGKTLMQRLKTTPEKISGWKVGRNCQVEAANLIGLFGAVGGLKGIDETF